MPSAHGSWTTCTPCSQKSHVHYFTHSPHLCAARAALICTTASCICLPLCHSRCSCLFIQRLALRLSWTEKQSRSGRISMHPAGLLGRWVFYILAVPASPYFHVGNTNILWVSRFWWCRHIQIDFHTFSGHNSTFDTE